MNHPAVFEVTPEIGKYHLVAELARGGMGIVHLAASQGPGSFNKLLVVKELKPELSRDDGYVSMFLDEARLAARLAHPNIVQTIEVGSEGHRHYMVMEFLDGRSLHRVARRFRDQPGFSIGAHLRVIAEALHGLHYAHDLRDFDGQPLGIVHRDVSPLNVFVTFEGQVKVLDFGIAKSADSSLETKTGVLKGRVAYMAPEQAWGQKVDRRADVYSAGVMLWEAAAGRRLWPGMNEVEILARLLKETVPPLSVVRPDVPEDLEAICERALARRPEDRYESAAELLGDLEAHLATRDDMMTMREIGALVSATFADERRRMNALIEETLNRVRGGPRSGVMPTLELHHRGTPSGARGLGLRDESQVSSHSRMSAAMSAQLLLTPSGSFEAPSITVPPFTAGSLPPVLSPSEPPTPWWATRRAAIGAASAGAALLLAVVAVLAGGSGEPSQPRADPTALVSAGAAGAAGSTRDIPDLVDVVVRVSPPSATIAIDGVAVPTNPFHARYAKDALVHHVMVSADGYDAKLEDVSFSSDVSIDVSLDHKAPPPQVRWIAPPPPPARAAKHAGPAAGSSPAPAAEPSAPAPARADIAPTGGRPPLRPITTSNPYGNQ
jgi:serine/threonine-protein kinase